MVYCSVFVFMEIMLGCFCVWFAWCWLGLFVCLWLRCFVLALLDLGVVGLFVCLFVLRCFALVFVYCLDDYWFENRFVDLTIVDCVDD